jgi:hypothetical protein
MILSIALVKSLNYTLRGIPTYLSRMDVSPTAGIIKYMDKNEHLQQVKIVEAQQPQPKSLVLFG